MCGEPSTEGVEDDQGDAVDGDQGAHHRFRSAQPVAAFHHQEGGDLVAKGAVSRGQRGQRLERRRHRALAVLVDDAVLLRSGRAITGLSMGGFGALNIAVNNPATFGAAGSLSGGVDPRDFAKNWGLEAVFGDRVRNADYWNEKAIVSNVHRFIFSGIDLAIDCGVDDFFIDSNRALHQRLLDLRIAHDYSERPGGHTWEYWDNAIRYQALFFADGFARKLAKP